MTFRSRRVSCLATATLILSGTALVGTGAAAGASMGCGDYSFGFEGTRLLNDGISDSAGPFTISLPAGTYDITLHSFDDHVAHPGQVEQTQEQWYFTLDNGYTSPVSSDIADDDVFSSDTFSAVTIEDATAITVQHLRAGGVNSVSPMCVGFTETAIESRPAVEQLPETPLTDVVPIVAAPALPTVVNPQDPPAAVEVKPAAVTSEPAVAAPAPQLALTGPGHLTWALVSAGTAMLLSGAALVLAERRERPRF